MSVSTDHKSIDYLTKQFTKPGKVIWIGIRSERKASLSVVTEVKAIEAIGLEGDHYNSKNGKRQVTLIQKEHIDAVASFLGAESINPSDLRRNIVVEGINLSALKGKKFQLGDAILEYTGECHPCSRMEENLGNGGYNAMRGHGGITASIISTGLVRNSDELRAIE